jgi:small nuclear ribonucleoprotein (snRNP)-like protein
MRVTAIGLIVSLIMATNAFAQESAAWRKVAETIPLGSKVAIHTLDGKRLKGTLMRVDDQSVMVKKSTRIPEPPVTVTFEQLSNIERDRGGSMNWAKALGVGAAAGAGAILTIFVIALQLD